MTINAAKSDNASQEFSVSTSATVAHNQKDPTDYLVGLEVKIESARKGVRAIYEGKVEFLGQFQVSDSLPEEKRLRAVTVNGASILYGAVREMVANVTARGPHPMITLPSLSFLDAETKTIAKPEVTEKTEKRLSKG